MIGKMVTDEDAARWGEEAARYEKLTNLLADQVMLQTRGVPFPIRYYALRMAHQQETFTVGELKSLLCAAVVALAVEREKA